MLAFLHCARIAAAVDIMVMGIQGLLNVALPTFSIVEQCHPLFEANVSPHQRGWNSHAGDLRVPQELLTIFVFRLSYPPTLIELL